MKSRLLFVDDDPMVLEGLVRSLRDMRNNWETDTATSGENALHKIEADHYDVVISDMRMPGMDGATLLSTVKERFPQVLRFVLSGQCDAHTMIRSVNIGHQFLSKPCDTAELKAKLNQTFSVIELLSNPAIKQVLSQMKCVPSPPAIFTEIMQLLNSEASSSGAVASVVSRDPAMCAKMLQLANSPLFGIRTEIANAAQAVRFLGFKTVKALATSVALFSRFGSMSSASLPLANFQATALQTAVLAKSIARAENSNEEFQDSCFTAGLLHDIGRLVVAWAFPEKFVAAARRSQESGMDSWRAELEVMGCTHGAVGGYLLGIWGLPHVIVETVAWHDCPHESPIFSFHPLLPVHVAARLVESQQTRIAANPIPLDSEFVERVGAAGKIESWRLLLQGNEQEVNRYD